MGTWGPEPVIRVRAHTPPGTLGISPLGLQHSQLGLVCQERQTLPKAPEAGGPSVPCRNKQIEPPNSNSKVTKETLNTPEPKQPGERPGGSQGKLDLPTLCS